MPKANRNALDRLPAPLPARDRAALAGGPLHALHLLRSSIPYNCAALSLVPSRHRCLPLPSWLSVTVFRLCCVCAPMLCIVLSLFPTPACLSAMRLLCCLLLSIYTCLVVTLAAVYTLSVIFLLASSQPPPHPLTVCCRLSSSPPPSTLLARRHCLSLFTSITALAFFAPRTLSTIICPV